MRSCQLRMVEPLGISERERIRPFSKGEKAFVFIYFREGTTAGPRLGRGAPDHRRRSGRRGRRFLGRRRMRPPREFLGLPGRIELRLIFVGKAAPEVGGKIAQTHSRSVLGCRSGNSSMSSFRPQKQRSRGDFDARFQTGARIGRSTPQRGPSDFRKPFLLGRRRASAASRATARAWGAAG